MAVATSIGLALLIGAVAGGSAASVAAKKKRKAEQQAALDAQQQQNDTVAPQVPAPPPAAPDATRGQSDALLAARDRSTRIRKRMGGNTGINGGRMGGAGGPLPVIRPRALTGSTRPPTPGGTPRPRPLSGSY